MQAVKTHRLAQVTNNIMATVTPLNTCTTSKRSFAEKKNKFSEEVLF